MSAHTPPPETVVPEIAAMKKEHIRWIAVAPEMLEALTAVRKWLDLNGTMPDRIDALVRAAIAKATGGDK